MSILIKDIPLGGYEITIMKDGERYRARVDGIWCEVEEIPTTEPDTDTISRQQAIDICRAPHMRNADCSDFEMAIMMLPPAQPDIIRCRNCKFASGDSRICMKFGHSPIGELDFCAWAERRTDG